MIKINSEIFDYRRKHISSNELNYTTSLENPKENSSIFNSELNSLLIKSCKICFETEDESEEIDSNSKQKNIMISVCNCKGSLKYIHFNCLSKWIESRLDYNIEYQSPICFKITLRNYYCELCKAELPCNIKFIYLSDLFI